MCHGIGLRGRQRRRDRRHHRRGEHVEPQSLPAAVAYLNAVSCPTASDCVAVGAGNDGAVIEATTDGGTTWSPESVPGAANVLNVISCPTASDCVAVGAGYVPGGVLTHPGVVVVTTDGGTTWTTPNLPGATTALYGVSCPTASDCFAVSANGGGSVVATTDGGTTWNRQKLPSTVQDLTSISCPTASNCWAGGYGFGVNLVVSTTTSGNTWAAQTPPSGYAFLGVVSCAAATDCWASAVNEVGSPVPTVAATTDGTTWTAQSLTGTSDVDGISCTSSSDCFIVGDSIVVSTSGLDATGTASSTTDGGGTWNGATVPAGVEHINAVSCTDASTCRAVGTTGTDIVILATSASPPPPPIPSITALTPRHTRVGAKVTISGTNLSGALGVDINGTAASIVTDTADQIVCTVPKGASSGPISVTTPGGTAVSAARVTVRHRRR